MKWVLNLYPPAWQRRYRSELAMHLDEAKLPAFRTTLDLLAGAVDAWRNPEEIPNTARSEGEKDMITAARCRPTEISKPEAFRGAALMLVVTFVLTAIGVTLDKVYGDHVMFEALIYSSFFIAFTVASRHTFLKPYSPAARNVITLLSIPAWYLFFLGTALLAEII